MTQYAISTLAGQVVGFLESDTMPVLPDATTISHVMVEPVIGWPESESPTEQLWISNGELHWVETAPLELIREAKNAEINKTRESVNGTTFTFRGKAIRCRTLDRSDIDGTNGYVALFGAFPEGWVGGWKAADNTYVAISTIDDWKAFYKAMVDTGNANFRYAQQLKGKLALAATSEEIAAIKWETPIG